MINVVCLKHGSKYSAEYVNKLHSMISRHLTVQHKFFCFTENPTGLNSNIIVKSLPDLPIQGWWWKPYLFKQGHFQDSDTLLFFDLDMIVISNIDRFVKFLPDKFVGLEDPGRVFRPNIKRLGSAVMKWPANEYNFVWDNLEKNLGLTKKFRGDQDWIWSQCQHDIEFFPKDWILSYKWEIRKREEIVGSGERSSFKDIRNPEVPIDCSVLAFHGFPQIHNVYDPIILDNWK